MGYISQRKDIAMASQRFLVPIDFSEYANQALEYAINLAGKLDACLTLLHVIQSIPLGGVDMGVTCRTLICKTWKQKSCRVWKRVSRVLLQRG